ncbi:MAG: PIN domain-containing protein [Thaumarchaeota archaeon]|nr:PIN domain-containing protein [Nitrososphaerota archaeon]
MKYCSDTWFLIKLATQDAKAREIKRNVLDGKDRLFIPTIVITELFRKLMQKGKKESEMDSFLNNLTASEKVKTVFLDEGIAKEAAKLSFSHNIPTVDSIVAATHKLPNCDKLLSEDKDLRRLHSKYLRIEFW